jgi:acetylglutamate kinase
LKGKKILVHGGGKIATKTGERMGIVSRYVNGRRITDEATIDLVTMVYGGGVNKRLVAGLQALGCNAIGLTGADANTIPAQRRPVGDIDYGFVGDIALQGVDARPTVALLDVGMTPVFAPLTHDGQGQMLNTNADTIAAALAVALSARYEVRLIFCFDKKGVLRNKADDEDVVPVMDRNSYRQLLDAHALSDGILPKLDNAFQAIESGVHEVLIGRADDLVQNAGEAPTGTLIRQ